MLLRLCFVDSKQDACKYLQTTSRWTDAAWLATLRLDGNDSAQVLRAWASFLASSGQLVPVFLFSFSLFLD